MFFSLENLLPHGTCILWRPDLLRMHVVSDALIGLGASSIGRLPQGYVQNTVPTNLYEKQIGQGLLAVTPMQLATAYSTLANGGSDLLSHRAALARVMVIGDGDDLR